MGKRVKEFPLRELNRRAFRVLADELGMAGLVRFLQHQAGIKANDMASRRKLLLGFTLEEIKTDVRRWREAKERRRARRKAKSRTGAGSTAPKSRR